MNHATTQRRKAQRLIFIRSFFAPLREHWFKMLLRQPQILKLVHANIIALD